ncbi:proteasome subunit alpha type-1 [Globomyces pollinis-pini]|nr:proteasome subunit alpha type-1 [Globomyces pollinis-pini]
MEAVKQGSATVGLRSNTHAVVVALKRSSSELASYQKKVVKVDSHIGVAFSGLTSDARVLSNFMRTLTLRSRLVYNRNLPISRVVSAVGDKAQINTQRYGRRPYGVGLLVIGVDESGPHLYECSPSGNYFDYLAVSIGARSQSAKTYLEKHFESFKDADLDTLIAHGLRSLRDTLQQEKVVNTENVTVAFVGNDTSFTIVDGPALQKYLDLIADNAPAGDVAMDTA